MFALSSSRPVLLPHPLNPNPSPRRIRRTRTRTRRRRRTLTLTSSREVERGVEFETGDSFFRRESAVGRDLGVLSAALLRRRCGSGGGLRVLDAMCGCGVRALRYLAQGGADFVWANDAFEGSRPLVLANLAREPRFSDLGERRWVVTHFGASRVLADCYLRREFFDLVDADSFGSDSSFLRSAIAAVKIGGLLYVTSTCGRSSGGHRPRWWCFTRSSCCRLSDKATFLILFVSCACIQSDATSFTWKGSRLQSLRLHKLLQTMWTLSNFFLE